MKLVFCVVLVFALVNQIKCRSKFVESEQNLLNKWNNFKVKYQKVYSTYAEEEKRFKIFKENLKYIDEHNQKYENGLTKYKMRINKFSDLTHDEFEKLYFHRNPVTMIDELTLDNIFETVIVPKKAVPLEIDWRDYGVVSPLKNQNHCGGCWSFAATGAIESQYYMKHKKMVLFSEQNLIDCSRPYLNEGCGGGLAYYAFQYVKDFGVDTESSYPYEGADWFACRRNLGKFGTKIDDYGLLQRNNETNLKIAVADIGPIAISYLVRSEFQHYHQGVFHHEGCRTGFHHAMLIVGYGTENGQDYWILKNSWGPYWGDNGFVKVARNMKNNCEIAHNAVYPLIF